MARYHINPKTGEPSVCRAKIKCRFGASESEHYPSKEAARSAYERKNSYKNIYSMGVIKDNIKKSIPGLNVFTIDPSKTIDDSRLEFVNFIKDSGVNSFTIGRISKATTKDLKIIEGYREIAQLLLDKFTMENSNTSSGRMFIPPSPISAEDKGSNIGENFTAIASGSINNVYLHKGTGMVFKIPNGFLERLGIGESRQNNFIVKENYEKINFKKLNDDFKVDYAKTYFLSMDDGSGRSVIIQAQEYLNPEDYEEYNIDWQSARQITMEFNGLLNDFHSGNARRHKESGRVILIDCIV